MDQSNEEKEFTTNKLIMAGSVLGSVMVGLMTWWAMHFIVGVIAWGMMFCLSRYILQRAGILPEESVMTMCRVCEREVARSARFCLQCGVGKPGQTTVEFTVNKVLDVGLLVVIAVGAVSWFIMAQTIGLSAFFGSGTNITEKSAMRVIEANAKTIVNIAYPTIVFAGAENDGISRNPDGSFSLVYTFFGNWDGTRGQFTQTYRFQKDGRLTGIQDGARSWLLKPFSEWELVRGFVMTAFKDDLAQNPQLMNLLESGNGGVFVTAMLNAELGR